MGSRGLWAARENPGSLCLISVSSVLAVCHCQMSLFQCHELLSEGPEVHELSHRRTSIHKSRQPHGLQPRAEPRGPPSAAIRSSRCVKKDEPAKTGRTDLKPQHGSVGEELVSRPSHTLPIVAGLVPTCPPALTARR